VDCGHTAAKQIKTVTNDIFSGRLIWGISFRLLECLFVAWSQNMSQYTLNDEFLRTQTGATTLLILLEK